MIVPCEKLINQKEIDLSKFVILSFLL